jgi:peptide/nickel transport system permease protein
VAWALAVPLGAWLARRPESRRARAVSSSLALASGLPTFWVAMLALFVFANPRRLDWFPFQGLSSEGGGLLDLAWHLVLPVAVLAYPTLAIAARHVEAAMRQALAHESVLAARARGIPESWVVWRHAFRNSALPLVTLLGLQLPHLVGGSVVVERVFGIPGMGLLAFDAIGTRDYPVVMAVSTVMGAVTLLAMVLTDVGAAAADPRLRRPELT